jgi:glycine/D-amino acid oxidase-like deaminating enzyme
MGLFTAFHASERFERVVVLERGWIGDPTTASYGRTRSFRNDYLDATYARLAHEAFRLWGEFEAQTATEVLVRCGCLNIAKRTVSPNLADTYAEMAHATLTRLGMRTASLGKEALRGRYPYLDADIGRLDLDAGVVDVPAVTRTLTRVLGERRVTVLEGVETSAVVQEGAAIRVSTDAGEFVTGSLVVTAGHGTNRVLSLLPDCRLHVPITKDRPAEAK